MSDNRSFSPWLLPLIAALFFIPGLGAVHLFDWDEVNFNIDQLINEFDQVKMKTFDFAGYPYFEMLQQQKDNVIDSWAIRYYASAFIRNKMHVIPNKSLVRNIGFDGSGIHCGTSSSLMNQKITDRVLVKYKEPKLDLTIEKKVRQKIYRDKVVSNLRDVLRRVVS